jgi:hypothetical protein
MSYRPLAAPVWAAHYTAADIALATAIRARMEETNTSANELRKRILAGGATVTDVLTGAYPYSPQRLLERLAEVLHIDAAAPDSHRIEHPREKILKTFAKHSMRLTLSVDDLLHIVGGDCVNAEIALRVLIAERQVCSTTVTRAGVASEVVYLMGRIPDNKPGRPAGVNINVPVTRKSHSERTQA